VPGATSRARSRRRHGSQRVTALSRSRTRVVRGR
jgi:hypothetical protein